MEKFKRIFCLLRTWKILSTGTFSYNVMLKLMNRPRSFLQDKFCEMFSNPYRKMKMTLYATITPSASNKLWDPGFMVNFMQQTVIKQAQSYMQKSQTTLIMKLFSRVSTFMLCNSQTTLSDDDLVFIEYEKYLV